MRMQPTIFMSGVTAEFGSYLDAVQIEILIKGYHRRHDEEFAGANYAILGNV